MACTNCEYGKVKSAITYRVTRDMAMDAGDMALEGMMVVEEVDTTCPCCNGDYERCLVCDGD